MLGLSIGALLGARLPILVEGTALCHASTLRFPQVANELYDQERLGLTVLTFAQGSGICVRIGAELSVAGLDRALFCFFVQMARDPFYFCPYVVRRITPVFSHFALGIANVFVRYKPYGLLRFTVSDLALFEDRFFGTICLASSRIGLFDL